MADAWSAAPLKEVTKRITKGTTPTSIGGRFSKSGINYVKVESITDSGNIDLAKVAHVDQATNALLTRSILEEGDVLFTIAGTIGRTALVQSSLLPANTNQAVAIVRPDPHRILPRFLYYALRDDQRATHALSRVVQSVQANFSLSELSDMRIPIPPKAQQASIADVLGALDGKIQSNTRIAQVEDALVMAYFAEFDDDLDSVFKLSDIATVVLGGTPDRSRPEFWKEGTIPWINSSEANEFRILAPTEYISLAGLQRSATKLMPFRATVVAITGATLGQISRLEIEACGNQSLVGLWAAERRINDWLFAWVRSRRSELVKHATGGAQQHINKAVVQELRVALPTTDALDGWQTRSGPLLDHCASLLRENLRLAALRDTLLPRLLSGELRVRDATPLVEEAV